MSSMLEQAILDAKELKEAAIKNAQQALIEKYSNEFEGEVEKLLEQTDPLVPAPVPAPAPVGAQPIDPETAKQDSDSKSNIFDNLQYAFADGEVIDDKVHTTGVVEIDLDSISKYSFDRNKKTEEQLALQELKALSRKSKINEELEEEMNDDEDYDEDSDSFPYDDEDFEDEEMDDDEDFEDEDLEDEEMDDDEDLDDEDLDDDDDFDVDIEDEEFSDDEDLEDEDLYSSEEDPNRFEIDYETDEEEDEDYNPDADIEDMDDEEELEEEKRPKSNKSSKAIAAALAALTAVTLPPDNVSSKIKKPSAVIKKSDLQEAIKLDYKRSGPRSPWNGMFREEGEHDVMLAELQAQIAEMEQEVEELKENNKKLKAGLKESISINENLNNKIAKFEEKLLESRFLNYKLLYTNKALTDSSLNERQKNKIAESINSARTAEEVKLLYETLKSTMRDGTSSSNSPKSLSEAVERRSSSILLKGSRAEPKKQNDYAERMKKLAGLT